MSPAEPLLRIQGLCTRFETDEGEVPAVDGATFDVWAGRTTGLVGESGCGKSLTALSVMRLVPEPGRICAGKLLWHGEDLLAKSAEEMRKLRGDRIAMVFQEPMTSLNPVFTIGDQISEVLRYHRDAGRGDARRRAVDLLAQVGVPDAGRRVDDFPHQLSGGQRQRVMLAMALACDPELLIADEPTTALDATVQVQILELLARLQRERQLGVLLITHDLGVVAESCDEVVVMYAGRVVEVGSAAELFSTPAHPYTAALLRSVPGRERGRGPLEVIPGAVPNLSRLPPGCRFRARCDRAISVCETVDPPLEPKRAGHLAACHAPVIPP